MTDPEPYAPHETRMLALQCAVEFVNGDMKRGNYYKADEVTDIARKFETFLVSEPGAGHAAGRPGRAE